MSMNLECSEVSLWQTPTWVTYICFSNYDGGWMGVRDRYILWVKSSLNGVWDSEESSSYQRDLVDSHVKDLLSFDHLNFSII